MVPSKLSPSERLAVSDLISDKRRTIPPAPLFFPQMSAISVVMNGLSLRLGLRVANRFMPCPRSVRRASVSCPPLDSGPPLRRGRESLKVLSIVGDSGPFKSGGSFPREFLSESPASPPWSELSLGFPFLFSTKSSSPEVSSGISPPAGGLFFSPISLTLRLRERTATTSLFLGRDPLFYSTKRSRTALETFCRIRVSPDKETIVGGGGFSLDFELLSG